MLTNPLSNVLELSSPSGSSAERALRVPAPKPIRWARDPLRSTFAFPISIPLTGKAVECVDRTAAALAQISMPFSLAQERKPWLWSCMPSQL